MRCEGRERRVECDVAKSDENEGGAMDERGAGEGAYMRRHERRARRFVFLSSLLSALRSSSYHCMFPTNLNSAAVNFISNLQ
jgi:hypothetical protein